MKLWTSGEVDSTVGDSFRETMNIVEEEVNSHLAHSSYGNGLENWDVIYILSANPSQEQFRYSAKKREIVDYQAFSEADKASKKDLFYDALIRSIYQITDKYELQDFDSTQLIENLVKLKKYGL